MAVSSLVTTDCAGACAKMRPPFFYSTADPRRCSTGQASPCWTPDFRGCGRDPWLHPNRQNHYRPAGLPAAHAAAGRAAKWNPALAQDWQKSFLQALAIPPQTAISPFLRLVGQPTAGETALLGDLTVEDGGVYPLATPAQGRLLSHPRKPGQAGPLRLPVEDRLSKAPGPAPLPYDRLYAKMKK